MNYWIDMDGVLATYHRKDYKCADPKFLMPGGHYFATLEPVEKMCEVITNLDLQCKAPGSRDRVIILTGICYIDDELYEEHVTDKKEWLQKHCPTIDINTQFVPAIGPKSRSAMLFKRHRLTVRDILIDDFNPNLVEWEAHGGTAIKYLNGVNNSKTFSGYKLPRRFTADECLENINAISKATRTRVKK